MGRPAGRLGSLETQVQQQTRARDIAPASWDNAMQRYSAGIGNYLDALSVEQQLIQAERDLASINAQRIDTDIVLMQALGGGFQTPASLPAAPVVAQNN